MSPSDTVDDDADNVGCRLPVLGKVEFGRRGFSMPNGEVALGGGVDEGGKDGDSMPGEARKFCRDDAGEAEDVPVLREGSNELECLRIGGVGVRIPLLVVLPTGRPAIVVAPVLALSVDADDDDKLENCVTRGFDPAPSRSLGLCGGVAPVALIFIPNTLGATMLLSRSCCICFCRFSCRSRREILCVSDGFF